MLNARSLAASKELMKTRREVLQGMIIAIGGSSLLSACKGVARVVASSSQGMRFYSEQEVALVSRLAELIIPRTDTPGALDVNVPGFLDGLMAEWANGATGREHRAELAGLGRMLGNEFLSVPLNAAEQQLAQFDAAAFDGLPTRYSGYRSLKGLITQAYFASEDGALLEQRWVAVPGRWDPCVEIQ